MKGKNCIWDSSDFCDITSSTALAFTRMILR